MSKQVKYIKKIVVDATASQITAIMATLDDGQQVALTDHAIVGDWLLTDSSGVSVASDAEFQANAVAV